MWAYESVLYQIYPLGFCGAPFENKGIQTHAILKVTDWIPHLKKLGVGAVLFNPVFESDTHGYNTRDYKKIDVRLGTNEDFKKVCDALHEEGIRVILDGVFNHAGRGFTQFQDVVKNREASPYKDWFFINFGGNSNYNDGLWYEGWEGNFDLVKLNLKNPAVADHLMDAVKYWIDFFDIDGIRLDVAYCLEQDFIRRLRAQTNEWKEDFFLVGEMIHGDYHRVMGEGLCNSTTNYECYKGLYSAFNSKNLFEIVHSLFRQFGPEQWTLYKGEHLLTFADNHDVTRIATILENKELVKALYTFLYGMPGIPCVYYGSEWGAEGDKKNGDPSLRPSFEVPVENELTAYLQGLGQGYKKAKALWYGDFRSLELQNTYCVFTRAFEDDRILCAVNIGNQEVTVHADFGAGRARDLATGQIIDFGGGLTIPAYTAYLLHPASAGVPDEVFFAEKEAKKPAKTAKKAKQVKTAGPDGISIKVKYLNDSIEKLAYIDGKSDWIDLRAAEDMDLKKGEMKLVPLGVAMQLPEGYEAHIVPRSSTYKNFGVIQANHMGVVDCSYCGDEDWWFWPALAMRDTHIAKNDRICQFRIMENQPRLLFEETDKLGNESRGGFGSTGVK